MKQILIKQDGLETPPMFLAQGFYQMRSFAHDLEFTVFTGTFTLIADN